MGVATISIRSVERSREDHIIKLICLLEVFLRSELPIEIIERIIWYELGYSGYRDGHG